MKIYELLALSFLLFAFTALSLPGAGAVDTLNPLVYDIFGHPLTTDHDYYIYGTPNDDTTNLEVTLGGASSGFPRRLKLGAVSNTQRVAISPVDTAIDILIRLDTNLNFRFNFSIAHFSHDQSTKWRIDYNTSLKEWFLTIGGHDTYNWFQIGQYKDTANYQLLYCPKPQPNCNCECVAVGVVLEDGVSYLAPNGKPFPIAFGRAENKVEIATSECSYIF